MHASALLESHLLIIGMLKPVHVHLFIHDGIGLKKIKFSILAKLSKKQFLLSTSLNPWCIYGTRVNFAVAVLHVWYKWCDDRILAWTIKNQGQGRSRGKRTTQIVAPDINGHYNGASCFYILYTSQVVMK